MTYYNNKKIAYLIDGIEVRYMTEQEAEEMQDEGYDVDAMYDPDLPLPDEAADDYLEHTCGRELPDGRTLGTCRLCALINDEEIPFS